MVNFRFHLVSLIAVFLALGLGILMGSTVVEQARSSTGSTVRSTRCARSRTTSANANRAGEQRPRSRERVRRRLGRVRRRRPARPAFPSSCSPNAASSERRGRRHGAAADRGRCARCPAVFWLEERWKLETEEDVQALRDAADLLGSASSVRTRALGELAARLTEPADTPVDERERAGRPPRPPRATRASSASTATTST